AAGEPGKLPDLCPGGARPDQEAGARRAVVGAAGAVLLRAPAELRPDERQHAVGDAARLEVALEGEERRRRRRERRGERAGLAGMRVVLAGRLECDALER